MYSAYSGKLTCNGKMGSGSGDNVGEVSIDIVHMELHHFTYLQPQIPFQTSQCSLEQHFQAISIIPACGLVKVTVPRQTGSISANSQYIVPGTIESIHNAMSGSQLNQNSLPKRQRRWQQKCYFLEIVRTGRTKANWSPVWSLLSSTAKNTKHTRRHIRKRRHNLCRLLLLQQVEEQGEIAVHRFIADIEWSLPQLIPPRETHLSKPWGNWITQSLDLTTQFFNWLLGCT